MIDLNSKTMLSDRINFLIDAAVVTERKKEPPRKYLGASLVGHACDRYVQYQWLVIQREIPGEEFSAKMLKIFDRGHIYEDRARRWLQAAGFLFAPNHPEIKDFDGQFGGHVDGILAGFFPGPGISIPPIPLPALWENKTLGAKGYKAVEKDGLKKYSPTYFGQVQIYMHYLSLPRCLFTVVCADTMELAHYLIDYNKAEAELLVAKIQRVFNTTKMGELLPRCTQDKEFYLCKWCPFRETCWK